MSLNEIELRNQTCEGFGVDTERRRRSAFDECIPSLATFCDCKVWSEKARAGTIRYVFFGLPADVEAAHFLYDLIDVTFDTEIHAIQVKRHLCRIGGRRAPKRWEFISNRACAWDQREIENDEGRARCFEQNIVGT